ncbi:helix-turn-helix domain-containing protein [Lentzea flava]|uniref:Transcriptional regulator n=1 Tax=Lentzea flava TaxID=103732 RepID=A0ABQ2UZG1_9PSEU|nr:helix-turn-helix transcriptional regulator [Lentzea flava]MCP2202723.1 Helix-turn-helix domain-containing protein [Lentzea flava]GGU61655.1 transcriptional regulator [Lentzea flava]
MPSHDGIGRTVRQIRHAKRKSLAVIAGRAGISVSYLSRIESGERALDRRSLIIALAEALEVAPSELTGAGLSSPGLLDEDATLPAVRRALLAVSLGAPQGQVQPATLLEARVGALLDDQRDCRFTAVGETLPGLIRDLHSTLDAGRDVEHVLRLVALLHVQGTQAWLGDIGASMDLAWQAAALARQAAERLDDPVTSAVAAFGSAHGLLAAGAVDLAQRQLSTAHPGTGTPAALAATGMLTLTSSLVAATAGDRAEQGAALAEAAALATAAPDGLDALWFGFSPGNVGVWRMSVANELGEHAEAARIGATVNAETLPSSTRRAAFYRELGRAFARLPKRHEQAVQVLRIAEDLAPARMHRHPFMRSVLAELLAKARRDAAGRELRGMAYRAGLLG